MAPVNGKIPSKPASYGLDWYGHGQHIAGIIASNGKTSNCSNCTQTVAGVAPGVNLINLKVLDASGEGSDSFVMAAINRAIALKNTYNIRVINLSLGRPVFESYTQDPLCQAVEAAWKAGIVVVVSAGNDGRDNTYGNDGYGTINAPGNDPYVITVGAMRSMGTAARNDDLIASYSSKGPSIYGPHRKAGSCCPWQSNHFAFGSTRDPCSSGAAKSGSSEFLPEHERKAR